MSVHIRPFVDDDRPWAIELMRERWGSEVVVTRGKARDASRLEGFVAELDGEPVGLAVFETRGAESELVTLDSLKAGVGVGSALVAAVANAAWRQECRRLSVVTTNDNVRALGFYQRRGFILSFARARSRNHAASSPRSPRSAATTSRFATSSSWCWISVGTEPKRSELEPET
jgi:GNAT superfamily N-acetyltransferase